MKHPMTQVVDSVTSITTATPGDTIDVRAVDTFSASVIITASSPSGCSVTPQWSNDKVNWYNLASATNIAASGPFGYTRTPAIEFSYFRLNWACSGGSLTVANTVTLFSTKGA